MPQGLPQMKKGKSLVNTVWTDTQLLQSVLNGAGVGGGGTRWRYMDVHCTIFSICTSEVFHDKKLSPQNIFT